MLGFLKNIIGTKQDRDLKQYHSLVLEINKNFESFQSLSGDELRGKTLEFRERISDYLSEIDAEIAAVTEKAVSSEDFNEKDELFKEVDELRKNRDKALEDILRQILPEAFAVVKEAGRRFTQNETVEVTATDHDRMLASKPGKTYVSIQGDKAVWKTGGRLQAARLPGI